MTHDPEIDVRRLRLAPGDVVILGLPPMTTPEVARHIAGGLKQALAAAGHAEVPVAIASNEVEVSILGPNEPGAMTTTGGGAPRHPRREGDGPSVVTPLIGREDR